MSSKFKIYDILKLLKDANDTMNDRIVKKM